MDDDPTTPEGSRDFEIRDFHPDPRSAAEFLAALWQKVNVIDVKVTNTNGRVRVMEKAMWAIGGGLVVIGFVIAPLFLRLVIPQ